MAFDLRAVQAQIGTGGLDGWLLTDFRGSNAPARRVLGAPACSRRWWYFVPAVGEPLKLEPAVEEGVLSMLPGRAVAVARREQADEALRAAFATSGGRVAMEYSPMGMNPYVAHVDAGTIERVRGLGVEVVSSQDLLQYFDARWTEGQWRSHLAASEALTASFAAAAGAIGAAVSAGRPMTEYEVTALCQARLEAAGMEVGGLNTSDTAHSRLPHYDPPETLSAPLGRGSLVLMDHYCKQARAEAVYADYTRVFFVGKRSEIPGRFVAAFDAIVRAREAAVGVIEAGLKAGREIRARELDLAARAVLIEAGYEAHIAHRTGHNLGASHVHGNGAHLDAVEHPDDRLILASTAFTIEPGLYFPDFGVRTEINAYVDADRKLHLTGVRADAIEVIEV